MWDSKKVMHGAEINEIGNSDVDNKVMKQATNISKLSSIWTVFNIHHQYQCSPEINWIYAEILRPKIDKRPEYRQSYELLDSYLTHYHWWIGFWSLLFGMKLLHIDKMTIECIQAKPFLPFLINFHLFHTFRELIFV